MSRDRLLRACLAEIEEDLAEFQRTRDAVQFHNDMAETLVAYHQAAYREAVGGQALAASDRAALIEVLGNQLDYLEAFTLEIERGTLTDAQIAARARLYAGSLKETWSRAATRGLDLPAHPGVGTQCLVNCGCRWEIDAHPEDGEVYAYWRRGKDDSCDTCRARERMWNPLIIELEAA